MALVRDENEPQYRIEASGGLCQSRTHILKHDNTFAVLNEFGAMVGAHGSPQGLYHRDTRFLSQLEVRLNDERPLLLSSTPADNNSLLPVDLANTDAIGGDGKPLHRELIYLNRRQFVWQTGYYELLLVRNFDLQAHIVTLAIRFAADFADIFEVRGQIRTRRGDHGAPLVLRDMVSLRYRGLDEIERVTTLRFSPAPTKLDKDIARFALELAPGQWYRLALHVSCDSATSHPNGTLSWDVRQFYRTLRARRRELRSSMSRAATIEGSNPIFNELAQRSMSDVYMLSTNTEHGPYPFAGIPWYSTPFGRDGIITALLMLWLDPAIAKGVLQFLAATQATTADAARDAEPGKILHEMRDGEMARLGEVPFGRYYGTVDATPLFVMLLGEYFVRTNDLALVRRLWPSVIAALSWMNTSGDPDRDGFVEYYRHSETGLINQGWKDSADAIFHADGQLAKGPIALCEVQGYVFAAKQHAARLARIIGDDTAAGYLESEAEILRRNFEAAFWCEELSTYALALDGDKRQCQVVASNAGHALLTGIAAPDRAKRVAQTLTSVGCFSGWGIRTLARTAKRYNPISYHNGSVWPHDNALMALGFSRYGLKSEVLRVFNGLFDATCHWEPRRLPELFCGFARRRTAPTMYPVACSPQAWASATVFGLLQASLGLQFDPAAGEIRFDCPVLPEFLQYLRLSGLRLVNCGADVLLQRYGAEVAVTVTERQGPVRVIVTH